LHRQIGPAQAGLFYRVVSEEGMSQTGLFKLHSAQHIQQQVGIYPNHVWQIDACFKKILKTQMWACQITDHASGWIYPEYVLDGNLDEALCRVLIHAMQERGRDDYMYGVPKILAISLAENNHIHQTRNICKELDIHVIDNPKNHHWITEQHRYTSKIVERDFEAELCCLPMNHIERINLHAKRWRCYFNSTAIHSKHGKTRSNAWKSIARDQLIKAPSVYDCWNIATRPSETFQTAPNTVRQANLTQNEFDLLSYYRNCSPETKLKIQKMLAEAQKINKPKT
jgi:hypothetical protein